MQLKHIVKEGLSNIQSCKRVRQRNEVSIFAQSIYHHHDDMLPIGRGETLNKIHANLIPNFSRNRKWLEQTRIGSEVGFAPLTCSTLPDISVNVFVHSLPKE